MSVASVGPSNLMHFGIPPEPVLPLTVEQYHAMIRGGILESGAPIELLEGWLVTKMTKNPPHSAATARTRRQLDAILPEGWSVETQEPLTTADSEPEPDVAVIRGLREDYVEAHPGPNDVGLVVEVADSSLQRHLSWKKHIYASAGISVYWIVNLIDRQVEVFTNPSGPGPRADFATSQVFRPGDEVPLRLEGKEIGRIAVAELLP